MRKSVITSVGTINLPYRDILVKTMEVLQFVVQPCCNAAAVEENMGGAEGNSPESVDASWSVHSQCCCTSCCCRTLHEASLRGDRQHFVQILLISSYYRWESIMLIFCSIEAISSFRRPMRRFISRSMESPDLDFELKKPRLFSHVASSDLRAS